MGNNVVHLCLKVVSSAYEDAQAGRGAPSGPTLEVMADLLTKLEQCNEVRAVQRGLRQETLRVVKQNSDWMGV